MNRMQVGLLVMGRKRPGFDPDWGARIREKVIAQMEGAFFKLFMPTVRIVDDLTLRAALKECGDAGVDVYVVVQPTMSDANLGVTIAQHARTPVIFWATPENPDGTMISSCSLVGAHTFGATLRLMKQPFELVYGMPGEADTAAQLDGAVRISHACGRIRGGKLGLIGYHAPGFIDMHASSWQTMDQLGLQLRHIGLHDYLDAAAGLDAAAVAADVKAVKALGLPLQDVDEADLEQAGRLYLALKQFIAEETLDAAAIRCWSELPRLAGQWPYLGMFRLGEEGFPVAAEGDVDGALSLWAGSMLGFGTAGYLSDWLEHDDETVTLWHAGNCPLALMEPVGSRHGPRIARHFNNKKPAVIEGALKAGLPVTVFRIWSCDNAYRLAVMEGETVPPRRELMGNNGLARIDGGNVRERFENLLHEGMPHHVAVFPGRHAATLRRFARQTGMRFSG
ncbi:MAG: sugar isomerase [Lentisphaerae bacterium]|nr:sugar isomerase [Lentisphaerota bacterium]